MKILVYDAPKTMRVDEVLDFPLEKKNSVFRRYIPV